MMISFDYDVRQRLVTVRKFTALHANMQKCSTRFTGFFSREQTMGVAQLAAL